MDKLFKDLFPSDLVETLLNTYANNILLSISEDDDQKEMIRKFLESFNRHGVSSVTVIKAFSDAFKEGEPQNGK